ncbi:MAG: 16S rRNA methyltransferase, partial [Verrucomicrobia bacterium]|nr:16S rRNA methyltransferase [Verrucomicrobiota bacterium]
MSPLRAWIDPAQARTAAAGSRLRLSGEESAHLVRSLRARRGDPLVLLDGEGHLLEGKLESADGEG